MFVEQAQNPFDRPRSSRVFIWLIVLAIVATGSFAAGLGFGSLLSTENTFDSANRPGDDLVNTNMPTSVTDDTTVSETVVVPQPLNDADRMDDALAAASTTPTSTPRDIFKPARTGTWLKITQTETGTLNVRSEPSASGTLVTKVNPGGEFEYTKEQSGWFQIIVEPGKTGWVSGKYTEKISAQ